jgi:predicted ATPase
MILKKFEYSEFENENEFWTIKSFELGRINLFVAKNATGKTRTLMAIDWLRTIIMDNGFNSNSNYTVEFSNDSEKYQYFLNNGFMKILFEKLVRNNEILLQRDDTGKGEIFTAQLDKNIEFQAPEDKLAISRRDKLQYPYLEKIHIWAENLHYYSFGTSMKEEYSRTNDDKNEILDGNSDNSVEVFIIGHREFDHEFDKKILSAMNSLGYDLDAVDVNERFFRGHNVRFEKYTLFVSEKDRNAIVTQDAMSQGMFRALSIIIHITYHAMMKIPTTILIDDIGEGLDYDRSTKLIKLLIELAKENDNIQLIMSTNDRFVMNNVPLEYWQVIQRSGGECKVFNYQNSKEKFEEFKYMGLNNFDFLATDFINTTWEKA